MIPEQRIPSSAPRPPTLGYGKLHLSRTVYTQGSIGNFPYVLVNYSYYDGNGQRVKGTVNGGTTVYVGNYLERSGETLTKYFYAGSQRIAMRTDTGEPDWLLTDHLGSTSVVAYYNGTPLTPPAVQLYRAWDEKRFPTGTSTLPTTFRYTGQRQEVSLGGADGLYYYGARWFHGYLDAYVGKCCCSEVRKRQPI